MSDETLFDAALDQEFIDAQQLFTQLKQRIIALTAFAMQGDDVG